MNSTLDGNESIKIYIFYYKPGLVFDLEKMYHPIMCGNATLINQTSMSGDDSGENISHKNQYFSELTGIYWVWKNTIQDITGSCHYRRYYTALPEPFLYKLKRLLYFPAGLYRKRIGLIYTRNTKLFLPRILKQDALVGLLEKYDAILPQARVLKYTVETHYQRYHNKFDLKILESILSEKFPEYLDSFHKFLAGNRIYANNMFILKSEHYQEFMGWWFEMLFEFERKIDLSQYTEYQKRIFGFIAERLLNIWFMHKNLKCIELPVIYFKHFKTE